MAEQKKSNYAVKILLSMFIICTSFVSMYGTQFKLFRTPKTGNVVTLTSRAKIVQVVRTRGVKSYAIWRNGKVFVIVNRIKFTHSNGVIGVLSPGRYVLRAVGGSVTIVLNTVFKPFNVTLWGRQNKLVKPLWDGNLVVLTAPERIARSSYNGTKGMGIFINTQPHRALLYFLSPHNIQNPGPKVIGGVGGKTLIGQTLPAGVYRIVPGRGRADGIVQGNVILTIR